MRFMHRPDRLDATQKGAAELQRTCPRIRCKECKKYRGTAWGIPICADGLRWPDPGQGKCKSFEVAK